MTLLRFVRRHRSAVPEGHALGQATGAANLSTGTSMVGGGAGQATGAGSLQTGVRFTGAAQGQVSAAASFPQSAPPPPSGFFKIPTVTDESSFYTSVMNWSLRAGSTTFVFVPDPGVITNVDSGGNVTIHGDTESDDLWIWAQQQARGHTDSKIATWVNRWTTYFKNTYLGQIQPGSIEHTSGEWDHIYGTGLVLLFANNGDAAALTIAEQIGDFVIAQRGNSIINGYSTGYGGGRDIARWGLLFCYLLEATGKEKWKLWRDRVLACYLTGGGTTWAEAPSFGIAQGGHWFVDRTTVVIGDTGPPNFQTWNGNINTAQYDAGWRFGPTFMMAMDAEFITRCYMQTGRGDLRDRIIKMAYFTAYYGHDPNLTSNAGPFTGAYYGIRGGGGGRYHRDQAGPATYDCSAVNSLVWGYKLTGDVNLLTRAKFHFRQGTLYPEATPPPATPLGPANQVYEFIDVSREHPNDGTDIRWSFNKGRLQYCYQIFENGGQPVVFDAGVPNYIKNLAPGDAFLLATKLSDAFQSFSGEAGSQISCMGYSGGVYDTKRSRFILHGGGHNGSNANGGWGVSIYSSENPLWTLFKPHTVPPSVSNFSVPSVETCSNGDPASSHTYFQIVYDQLNDKLQVCGLGSAAGQNGASFARLRFLNLTTNVWDNINNSPAAGPAVSMYVAVAAYDEVTRSTYISGGQASGRFFRYDNTNNTQTQLTVAGVSAARNIDSCAAINPVGRYMIIIGGAYSVGPMDAGNADMVIVDLTTLSGANVTGVVRGTGTIAGFPAALRGGKMGLEFHPPSGSFFCWPGNSTVIQMIPPAAPMTSTAWTFVTHNPGGTGLPIASTDSEGGVYSKFRWAPYPQDKSRGVFVMSVNQGDHINGYTTSRVCVWKPNADTAQKAVFFDPFDTARDPITLDTNWVHNATSWQPVRIFNNATLGLIACAKNFTELEDDAYAYVNPSRFPASAVDQEVIVTIGKTSGVFNGELEILLRVGDTSSTVGAYECLFNVGNGAHQVVRWNGPLHNFTVLFDLGAGIPGGVATGDRFRARVVGTNPCVINTWHEAVGNPGVWVPLAVNISDSNALRRVSGQPGMSFYAHATDANKDNFGCKDFSAREV